MGIGDTAEKQWCFTGGHPHFFLPASSPLHAVFCHYPECLSVPLYILLRVPLPVACLQKSDSC